MPTYTFVCLQCRKREDVVLRVAERDTPRACACEEPMQRLSVYAPMLGGVDFREYVSPASGRLISSATMERDELARTNCVIDEPGMKGDIARNRRRIEEESDAQIERLVSTEYAALAASNLGVE